MQPSPEKAFDSWFRALGFRGRHTLSDLTHSMRDQLRGLQNMYNEAFERERTFPEYARTLPLYFDYLDVDDNDENAIATHDNQNYAFIGITLPLVFKISNVCLVLSKSDAISKTLRLRTSDEPYNELQATLFYILLSFVVAHEWSHHKHGHLGQLSSQTRIFQEVLDSGLVGSVDDQIKEIAADGYAAFLVLTHLYDSRRGTFLPFLKLDPSPPPENLDQRFLAFFMMAVAGYMFLRPPDDLNGVDVYRLTHPPLAYRLNFLMREVAAWCSHNRPALEDWLMKSFGPIMNATVEAIHGVTDYRQVWANQLSFRRSDAGRQYDATLTEGIAVYRKSWGADTEEAQIIEPPQELQLHLVRGVDDPTFQKAVTDFSQGLRGTNVSFSTRSMAFDGATSTGLTGILILVATTLGPRAIIEFRKLLQSYLTHGGRKIKLKNGPLSIEASPDDFLKVFTPEQIQQLIEPRPPKALPATKPPRRDKGLSD